MFGFGKKLSSVENVEWGFEKISQDTFRTLITFQVKSETFKKLLMKNSSEVVADELIKGINEIKTFTFSEEILKLLKTALAPAMNDVIKELKKNKIIVYRYDVKKESKYVMMGTQYNAYIIIEGTYAQKV